MRPARARYDVIFAAVNAVVIVDQSNGETPTVTNDAEAVVADLASQISVTGGLIPAFGDDAGGPLDSRRLFYVDSQGRLDELCHDGCGRFLGFAPILAPSVAEPMKRWRRAEVAR